MAWFVEGKLKWPLRAIEEKERQLRNQHQTIITQAQLYFNSGNWEDAINLLTQCANRNCNQSCIVLGQIYSGKYGTYNDPEKAALWYKKANEIFQQEE